MNFSVKTALFRVFTALLCGLLVLSVMPLRAIGESQVYRSVKTNSMQIAITFDDGPHPGNTGRILDVLKKHEIRATFFILGCNAGYYPEPLVRAIEEGHEIENHTFDHKTKGRSTDELIRSIDKTGAVISAMTGRRPRYFRPPGGKCTPEMRAAIDFLGYEAVYWTIDSEDWKGKSAESIVSSVMRSVRGNDIILFHDYTCPNDNTVEALLILIPRLLRSGYRFVTVDELKSKTASRK